MTALRGRTFPPPLELRLLAELAVLLLWLLEEVLVVLGRLLGLLLPAGLLELGVEALGLLPDGAAVPEGRLPLGVALLDGLLPLPGAALPLGLLLGLAVPEGALPLFGCEETGLFSAKTGSFPAGLS